MITSCMIFLASFGTPDVPVIENPEIIQETHKCTQLIPSTMLEYVPYIVEHFDEKHYYKAMRISWCESRGNPNAFRKEDNDSGLMQFIPNTWNWVAEKFSMPLWDDKILTYQGVPYQLHDGPFVAEGFKFQKAQYVPYINIKMASHLAEDIYTKKDFRDWNSSKWCWENPKYFEKRWRQEGY